MPLVRFELKNEYGLGDPELYREPAKREDSRALLDGVAVAGLVGILRQLGDLAEFAADIFHDLHEQVMATTARGHKILARVQHIEAVVPSIEKALKAQKSHVHFAYIAGSDWHPNVPTENEHLLRSDLPQFIMDSYEECRDPPRLYLLDKFDSAGSGACLKRYSDPSYFRKVWASSVLRKAEKVSREKKTREYKRKGSRQRNLEVQHVESLSRCNSRMRFTSPSTDGQRDIAETLCTSDMRIKTELELSSRSTSFGSRTRFSCEEPGLGVNSLMEPDKPEYNEPFTTFKTNISDEDACASVILSEQNREGTSDDSQLNSLQAQSAPRSPSLPWDEKTEIVKPDTQLCQKPSSPQLREKPKILRLCDSVLVDRVKDSECKPLISEPLKLECGTTQRCLINQEDILFDIGNVRASFPGNNQFEEIASETDNYVDAHNSLGSETETDSEIQTKREVQPPSNWSYQQVNSGTSHIQEMVTPVSYFSEVETPIASYSQTDEQLSQNIAVSVSSEGVTCAQSLHMIDLVLNLGCVDDDEVCGNCEPNATSVTELEAVNGSWSSGSTGPNLQILVDNEIAANICKSRESCPEISDQTYVDLWTNGGLLGVEPSKPPDFNVQKIEHENSVSGTNIVRPDLSRHSQVKPNDSISRTSCTTGGFPDDIGSGHQSSLYPGVLVGGRNENDNFVKPVNPIKCSASCKGDVSLKNFEEPLPDLSKFELEELHDSQSISISCHINKHHLSERDVLASRNLPITADMEVPSNEYGPDLGMSSSLSGLTRRFLANGFHRKTPVSQGNTSTQPCLETPDLTKLQESSLLINDRCQNLVPQTFHEPKTEETLKTGFSKNSHSSRSLYSEHPSPPLEHMKISFHPINGMETSKLKLEFPDGHHESIEELMFPSFQLLPGPTVSLQDINSDSDDDTFGRSYPDSSEDILSRFSESNSELWEQDEQSGNENLEVYDNSRRVSSSTASVSSRLEIGGMTHHSMDQTCEFENFEGENSITSFKSAPILDIPSLQFLKSSMSQQEKKCDSRLNHPQDFTLQHQNELPPTPPLPPLQWRKPSFASVENTQHVSSEDVNHSGGLQGLMSSSRQHPEQDGPILSPIEVTARLDSVGNAQHGSSEVIYHSEVLWGPRSTGHQLAKQNVPKPPQINEVTPCPNKSMHGLQKINGHKELIKSTNGKELDEREDLLHQIRNKSFRLRQTVTSMPGVMVEPNSNVKVTAILEKANAIRQAFVGSDEGGEDENWSDA